MLFSICVLIQIYFKIGPWRERRNFQKIWSAPLPLHPLKASILNPGMIFLGVRWHIYHTTSFRRVVISCDVIICMNAYWWFPWCWKWAYLWWRSSSCVLHAYRKESGKTSALGRHEFVVGLRRDGYVRYGVVRYNERWLCWLKYIRYANHAGNT